MTQKAFAYFRTSSATNVSKNKDGDEAKKNGLREDKDSRVRQEVAVRDFWFPSEMSPERLQKVHILAFRRLLFLDRPFYR